MDYIFPYIGNVIIPTVFQRGGSTTQQNAVIISHKYIFGIFRVMFRNSKTGHLPAPHTILSIRQSILQASEPPPSLDSIVSFEIPSVREFLRSPIQKSTGEALVKLRRSFCASASDPKTTSISSISSI